MEYYSSSEEDDYGFMGHGEGPSLDHYEVLPDIPTVKKKKKKKVKIKIKTPLPILPDIIKHEDRVTLSPQPPLTPNQGKCRRRKKQRKSPLQLMGADLNPALEYDVLPQIMKQPATQRLKEHASDIIINRSNGELNVYKKLPLIKTKNETSKEVAAHVLTGVLELSSSSNDLFNDFQHQLDRFKREMEDFGEQNVSFLASNSSSKEEVVISYANYSKPCTPSHEERHHYQVEVSQIQTHDSKDGPSPRLRSRGYRRKYTVAKENDVGDKSKRYTPAPPATKKKSQDNIRCESGYASIFKQIGEKGGISQVTDSDIHAGIKIIDGEVKFVEGVGRCGDVSPLHRI